MMNKEEIKALFPDDIEAITISKNDYDRLFGELSYKNIELQQKIDKAIDLIEKSVTSDVGIDSNGNIIKYHQLTEDETGELLEILGDKQ